MNDEKGPSRMGSKIKPSDIMIVKPNVGVGINLPGFPIPTGANDKDQFKAEISVFTPNAPPSKYDVFLEVAPKRATTLGNKVERCMHGFIQGISDEKLLLDAEYKIEKLQPFKNFSLVGVI